MKIQYCFGGRILEIDDKNISIIEQLTGLNIYEVIKQANLREGGSYTSPNGLSSEPWTIIEDAFV